MRRLGEQLGRRSLFYDPAGIHDCDPIGPSSDDAKVVSNEKHGHATRLAQPIEDFQDLGLNGHIQGGRRLIRNQQFRLSAQRDRDHHALAHPAAQLVGVALEPLLGVGNSYLDHQCLGPLHSLAARHRKVSQYPFGDLVSRGEDRIQARHGILEHHPDPAAPNLAKRLALE